MMQDQKLDFPKPIASAMGALSSDVRRNMLIHIENAGALPYSELLEITGLQKGRMNYHLKTLISAGVIRNLLKKEEGTNYSSYYEVSDLGRSLIEGILSAFKPSTFTSMGISYDSAGITIGASSVGTIEGNYVTNSTGTVNTVVEGNYVTLTGITRAVHTQKRKIPAITR